MDYQVVSGTTTRQLEDFVKEEIAQGWIPLGGLAIDSYESDNGYGYKTWDCIYHQAMTKEVRGALLQ